MTAGSSPTGWSSPSSDRTGSPIMRRRRPLPAIGEGPTHGMSGRGGRPARNGILPRPWQRRGGGARGRTGAPCHDSAHSTAESPTHCRKTSRSDRSGSRKSRAYRGLRSPGAPGPIATPSGVGPEGRTRPNYQHRKALLDLAGSMGLGHLFIGRSSWTTVTSRGSPGASGTHSTGGCELPLRPRPEGTAATSPPSRRNLTPPGLRAKKGAACA